MDKDLVEYAIKYAQEKGVDFVEARMLSRFGSGFVLNNGNLEVSGFDESSGIGIKIIVKNNEGFLSLNNPSKDKVKEMIDRKIISLKNSSKLSEPSLLSEESTKVKEYIAPEKIKIKDLSPEKKLKIILDIDKAVKDTGLSMKRYFSLGDSYEKKYLVNSDGSKIYSEIPLNSFFWFLTVFKNGQSVQKYGSEKYTKGYEMYNEIDLGLEITETAKILNKILTKSISSPKEPVDVVIAPEVVGIMVHESAGHPYEADRIFGREAAQAGESFVTEDMTGTQIGSECCTVVDDPTIKGSAGFYLYDDEGIKAREKILMSKGVITEFLHDRSTAKAMGLKSNGSARANDYNRESLVRMSNTYLKPGDYKEEELFEDIKKGVYLKSFMEWNIDDKRYNQKYTGCEAYLIEKGELKGVVKDPAIEITTPKLWKSFDAVADNVKMYAGNCGKGEPAQGIPVLMGGPSARLRGIRLC